MWVLTVFGVGGLAGFMLQGATQDLAEEESYVVRGT